METNQLLGKSLSFLNSVRKAASIRRLDVWTGSLVLLIKIENQERSEQGMDQWGQTSPLIRKRSMDDIFHLIKAYNVVEFQLHLLLILMLEGDVRLRSLPP